MRVVALVSSPRRGGNSELAAKEILSRLPEDWEKRLIRLNELDIKPCTACYACLAEGAKCKQKDDLSFLIRNVKHADKVIICAPAYMLGAHTTLKVILDRLLSVTGDHRVFGHPDCVIANFYGMAGWEGAVREDSILFARKFHLNVIAQEVMLATLPGDSVQGENLDRLHVLADALMAPSDTVKNTVHDEALTEKIRAASYDELTEPTGTLVRSTDTAVTGGSTHRFLVCPFCKGTHMQISPDGLLKCRVCGGEYRLVNAGGADGPVCEDTAGGAGDSKIRLEIEYDPGHQHRLTAKSLDEHIQYLDEKKKLFLETRGRVKEIQARYADMDWKIEP